MEFHEKLDHILEAVDSMNCGFVSRDLAGVILHVNSRMLKWLGYQRSELEGHAIETMFPADMHDVVREARHPIVVAAKIGRSPGPGGVDGKARLFVSTGHGGPR